VKKAKRDFERLDRVIQKRVIKKLEFLRENPVGLSKRLVDFDQGEYCYRIGDFRVCFDVDGKTIVILRIRHRREVYK